MELLLFAIGAGFGIVYAIRRQRAAEVARFELGMLDADDLARLQLAEQAATRREVERLL
jgi:hypothetical protein